MLLKFLSNVIYLYKKLTTPKDYSIIMEELEYSIDYDMKYQVEDRFWKNESKDWDGILENFCSFQEFSLFKKAGAILIRSDPKT